MSIRIFAEDNQRAGPARTGLGALIEQAFGIEFDATAEAVLANTDLSSKYGI